MSDAEEDQEFNETGDTDVELIIDDGTPTPVAEEVLPDEYKGMSKAQLVDRVKVAEQQAADRERQSSVFDRLGTTMDQIANRNVQPAAPAAQPEDPNAIRERINQKSLESPMDAMDDYFTHKLGPMVGQTLQGNLTMARKLMELDPEKGPTFRKYIKDIDKLVESAPAQAKIDPTIYDRAYKQVISDHIDEVIAEKVAAAVAKTKETVVETPKPASFSEGRGAPQPRAGVRQVKLSVQEVERLSRMGISKEDMYNYGK